MSELQSGLLVIGIVVVIAVYSYGAWQQWQYRRKYGSLFQSSKHEDVLHPPVIHTADVLVAEEGIQPSPTLFKDEICSLISDQFDSIVHLVPQSPLTSATLDPFWKRRFDFGKSVVVCGLNAANKSWERLIPDSPQLYNEFKLALQLADRSGPVSELRLKEFQSALRGIATQIQAKIDMHSAEDVFARALELDKFCVEVDHLIGLNLLPGNDRKIFGSEIARIANARRLSLQSDGAFYLTDNNGCTLCKMCDMENRPFQHHTLNQLRFRGLTLLLDVPRVAQPVAQFDIMVQLARTLSDDFHAALVDDHGVALGAEALAQIRAQVGNVENRILAGGVTPGSTQALRLFS